MRECRDICCAFNESLTCSTCLEFLARCRLFPSNNWHCFTFRILLTDSKDMLLDITRLLMIIEIKPNILHHKRVFLAYVFWWKVWSRKSYQWICFYLFYYNIFHNFKYISIKDRYISNNDFKLCNCTLDCKVLIRLVEPLTST